MWRSAPRSAPEPDAHAAEATMGAFLTKLLDTFYAKKLEALLAEEANTLHRCAFCSRLFTSAQREWEPCTRAPPLVVRALAAQ